MDINKIHEKLVGQYGESVILGLTAAEEGIRDPFITVEASRIHRVCLFCKTEPALHFDFCQSITGIDTGDALLCVYHLFSYDKKHTLVLKTSELPRSGAELPSCTGVWAATDWYEREVYDLFGIRFANHPDLRRLLLPEDWQGHPMLKDWKEEQTYNAVAGPQDHPLAMEIPTRRDNPLDLLDTEGADA